MEAERVVVLVLVAPAVAVSVLAAGSSSRSPGVASVASPPTTATTAVPEKALGGLAPPATWNSSGGGG